MSKAITITAQVNVNGVNADNYTDAQLFDMIRQQETEIKNLQALTNKPQSLLREIDTRQAGIDALVSFMNERDAKLNPVQPTTHSNPQPTAADQLARGQAMKVGKTILGASYRDKITGFTGVATGHVSYLTGCNQVLVQPKLDAEGKVRDSMWFDEQRLEIDTTMPITTLDNSQTPGFDKQAPKP